MLIARPPARIPTLEKAALALIRGVLDRKSGESAEEAALRFIGDDAAAGAIITRADVSISTTGGSGWPDAPNFTGEFLATLAPISAVARLISLGLSVPLARAASQVMPTRSGAIDAAAAPWAIEGAPGQVREYGFSADCALTPRKLMFSIVVTRELAKRAGGAVLQTLLREDAAAALDAAYFSATAAGDAAHAGLLNGLVGIDGYGGGDRVSIATDLTAISDAISAGGSGQNVFVMSPKRAARLPILWPELRLSILPSLAVADDVVIGVDALSLVHGSGTPEIDASREAVLHMSDEPAEIVSGAGPTTADPVRSMWQTDAISFRLVADVAFGARRTGAVAFVTGAIW